MKPVCTLLLLSLFISCKGKKEKEETKTDTPTSGKITISVDQSLAPVLQREAETFTAIYKDATIHVDIKSEPDAVNDLLTKKTSLIVIPRQLSDDEVSFIQQSDYAPRQILIGRDAAAFVLNNENRNSSLTYDQITGILEGKISDWKQIDASSSLGKISLIFDDSRSGLMRYIKQEVLKEKSFTQNAFAVDSNAAVINYVQESRSAIGVIGVSWLSQKGDSLAESFLQSIQVAAISNNDSTQKFFQPNQISMTTGDYPFLRNVYVISREEGVGLGTGFVKYLTTDEGQTIIRLSGLVPAHPPVRIIELKNEF